ncbi:glycosyltransferase [Spirosoma rigui]|uniref:glycosyltransferase n=1 Tax=Spirosoma rigui TaxID=564064 RepID=UPI0014730ECF|nr:glycosyltransferase [Spirosoma rigui]
MSETRVYIDPRTNIEYSAYYIQGLYEVFGRESVTFSMHHFATLPDYTNLNFIIRVGDSSVKYTIDYNDVCSVNKTAYAWCDWYGKINLRAGIFDDYQHKIVNIPPGFGIRIWGLLPSLWVCLRNMVQTGCYTKRFVSGYIKQIRHLPITAYTPDNAKPDYVFSFNTLWNSDEWIRNDETVNLMRYNFYNAITDQSGLQCEVGFSYSMNKNTNALFQKYASDTWIPKTEYLQKIKQSVLVFNTPAWDLCHGWKLAEYIASGKAIISTPLANELPFELIHGRHVHFVSGTETDIRQAIEQLLADNVYRQSLETGARQYYTDYAQPQAVIKRLLASCPVAL